MRAESRIPALGAVSLTVEVVEKRKLTRGRRHCRLSRHDGREGDALCQVIRAVVKCRTLMRGKPNREASWLAEARRWRSKAGSLVGKGDEEKSGAQRKFMGATAGGAPLTALTHGQNSRQLWSPGTVQVRERRLRQHLNGGEKQKKRILLKVNIEGRGNFPRRTAPRACHRYLGRSESLRKWIARSF